MRNFFQRKVWVILLATLALGALTVLAVSLNDVSFRDAQRYSQEPAATPPPIQDASVSETFIVVPIWKQVILWGLIALVIILIGLLLSPDSRKKFFRMILRLAITLFAIYYLFTNYGEVLNPFLKAFDQAGQNSSQLDTAPPMPEFQPPHVSPAFSYLISFAVALVLIVVLWSLYRGWQRYSALNTKKPLGEIARIARSSLKDISDGRDSSDVIIHCYLRMSDVVADKRRLHREIAMTPQEFAVRLERAGLPGDAVRRLTGLFEMVRYGDRKSAPKDVTEAVTCLNAILRSCGETL